MSGAPRALVAGEVDLWLVDPERAGDDQSLLRWLTPEERHQAEVRRVEKARREYLVTRAMVRRTLSRYAPVEPSAWVFEPGEHGRPKVISPRSPVHFNVTHTDGLVACAVSLQEELGIDAEFLDRPAPMQIVDRFFAPGEIDQLRRLPGPDQPRRFFELWTLKEAYLKARSQGLSLPLRGFAISVGPPIAIRFGPEIADHPERWKWSLFQPTPRHLLALAAVAAEPPRIACQWMDLAASD